MRRATAAANCRADMDERKIAGAAAEVADQNQLVVIERGLVIVSRGHGLHFELNLRETGHPEGFAQTALRESVIVFSFGADKPDRASDDGGIHRDAELLFGLVFQIPQNARDQFFESSLAAEDLCRFQGAATEERLGGLNEAAFFFSLQISFDARRTRP